MISMWKVRDMVDKATNLVMNYTETEAKVREATNNDPGCASPTLVMEIAGEGCQWLPPRVTQNTYINDRK